MKINNATTWLLAVYDSDLTSTQKIICAYLRSHMNDYRDVAWPSVDRIAAKCSLGRRTVLDNLPKICEQGFLLRNGTSDVGTIRYAICSPEEGGAAAARVRETTKRGAVAAPEVNKEVNNTLSKGFKRPSVSEVKAYCDEMGYSIDPETFVNYYNSNGWKVGRSSMKCWKSATTNWQKREKPNGKDRKSTDQYQNQRKLSGAERTRLAREAIRASEQSSDMGCVESN